MEPFLSMLVECYKYNLRDMEIKMWTLHYFTLAKKLGLPRSINHWETFFKQLCASDFGGQYYAQLQIPL